MPEGRILGIAFAGARERELMPGVDQEVVVEARVSNILAQRMRCKGLNESEQQSVINTFS